LAERPAWGWTIGLADLYRRIAGEQVSCVEGERMAGASKAHILDVPRSISLADKYDLSQTRIFVSGTQAIVRLLLMQRELDRRAGLSTAGFISGYRGSPLGGLDLNILRAKTVLEANDIFFQPGLNEDLAATAIWGAQQAEMRGEGRYDGVFGLWYGKGPGVDRSGDVLRHANLAGTSRYGGVLALMGDDHTAESSTTAHQSEFTFVDVMMPILSPAGVQELIDYGLLGYAMSRFTGCWVGIKCVKDTVESTASIDASLDRVRPVLPSDFLVPADGLNIRASDPVLAQEKRLQNFKHDAVLAWLSANRLNKIIMSGGPHAKIGVIAAGKTYLDVRQALDDLGIDEVRANEIGLRLYKIACPWPLEPKGLREFARGLSKIIVVEEKRSLIEAQVRDELYGSDTQPVCIGKKDEKGEWLFPVTGALDANDIAVAIGRRLLEHHRSEELQRRLERLERAQRILAETTDAATRTPYFCSGCPHNISTKVPDGMRAYAGIGCHYMVQRMDRATEGYTQMGGEGANWIGEAPFSTRGHIIQNLGDGTYDHSGVLPIRWAAGAGVNITFKILFNDASAMTGGQSLEGDLTVDKIARQVVAEGANKVVVVTDEPKKYAADVAWPDGMVIKPREDLDAVQRALAATPGTTVLIYDQTCAAEMRRRRKRGLMPEPDRRVIINELVCEGCGDCGIASNCVAVQPIETEFGRKRTIDQSSCNKDFSCLDGFCPAFVTVHGGKPKVLATAADVGDFPPLPHPDVPVLAERPFSILITGVGGTGVVTIGAFLAMAAHLEGKGCGSVDMSGIAQKGGAVHSHIKIAATPEQIHAISIAAGGADLVLGCDLVVSGSAKVLAALRPRETCVVVNTAEIYPGDFTRDADFTLPVEEIKSAIDAAAGEHAAFFDATGLSTALFGTSIMANIILVGFAWQRGFLPLSEAALLRAIELNDETIDLNKRAFLWGRRAAFAPERVAAIVAPEPDPTSPRHLSRSFEESVDRRAAFLTAYQDKRYAGEYLAMVACVAEVERRVAKDTRLAQAVARNLFKLMAVKDEYEVARLYADGSFARQLAATFDGDVKLEFHLAPPILGRRNAKGELKKMSFGPWMMRAFNVLAKLKGLRGTPLDIFGWSQERRMERKLLADYQARLEEILVDLTPENHACAVALASLPEMIRGFGHVKLRNVESARAEEEELLARFRAEPAPAPVKLAAE
jgi:indolepyruvate ferredoxin oxidoreductase